MVPSRLGRKIFECPACREIIQLLEVEVPSTLPWSESYSIRDYGGSPDGAVR
jgi:hypothetical protein